MSTEHQGTDDIADLSYEEARDELVAIVARIEGGNASLEESMDLWARGEALAAHCQAKLDQAQEQLDRGAGDPTSVTGSADRDVDTVADGGPEDNDDDREGDPEDRSADSPDKESDKDADA